MALAHRTKERNRGKTMMNGLKQNGTNLKGSGKTLELSATLIRSMMLLTVHATESHFQILIAAVMKYLSPRRACGQQTSKQYIQFVPRLCKRGFI